MHDFYKLPWWVNMFFKSGCVILHCNKWDGIILLKHDLWKLVGLECNISVFCKYNNKPPMLHFGEQVKREQKFLDKYCIQNFLEALEDKVLLLFHVCRELNLLDFLGEDKKLRPYLNSSTFTFSLQSACVYNNFFS